MQIKRTNKSSTEVTLSVIPNAAELTKLKEHVLKRLAANVRITGFRAGHAPLNLVEKNVDQSVLQQEFLEEGVNHFYTDAIKAEGARPVTKPEISITKFVPFATLEFDVNFGVVGSLKVADYKSFKVKTEKVVVTDSEVAEVLSSLQIRLADRETSTDPAMNSDQVTIDFKGTDDKNQPVKGAEGKDYPLILGSNTFIPGFEPNIIDMTQGETKSFIVPFPKDYNVKALQGKKVTFEVTINKIEKIMHPPLNDEFAKKVGPFNSLDLLKDDIKKQLGLDKNMQQERAQENDLLDQLFLKSKVELPTALVDEQIERAADEEKRNLVYRGQTWEEHLIEEGMTEEEHNNKKLRSASEKNLSIAMLLSEIAAMEKLDVTNDELTTRLEQLKTQYANDPQMSEALKDTNYQRDVAARMLSEKTLLKMLEFAR